MNQIGTLGVTPGLVTRNQLKRVVLIIEMEYPIKVDLAIANTGIGFGAILAIMRKAYQKR